MGSKKQPKQKTSNYLNMQSYRNSPYVKTNVAYAKGVDVGDLVDVTEQEALRYGNGIPVSCITIEFKGLPPLRLTDAALDVNFEGITYQATPDLQNVTSSKATNKINSQGGKVTLSAIDSTFIQIIQANQAIRARVEFSIGMLDTENNCLAIFVEQRGFIKLPTSSFDPNSGKLEVMFETTNFFDNLTAVPGIRPASAIQKSIWPGDKGLDEVLVVEDEEWKIKQ